MLTSFMRHYLWTAFPLIHYPSIHLHDFLCHIEILNRLCARWSSRNCHNSPCLPNTFQRGNKNKCPDVRGAVVENNTRVNMSAIISYANWLINLLFEIRLQQYSHSVDFQWVDKGQNPQIGGHHFLPGHWNLYVSCVLSGSFYEFKIKKPLDSSNKTPMKIYTYYDNLPAQQRYYTNDKRIALEGHGSNIVDANENRLKCFPD